MIAPKAPEKLNSNALSDNCTGVTGEGSSPTEFAGLVGQNHNVPEPSTGLLLLAAGVIGVGARMKSTFRASPNLYSCPDQVRCGRGAQRAVQPLRRCVRLRQDA